MSYDKHFYNVIKHVGYESYPTCLMTL